jgi:biopolymer transport protein ExbD
VKKAVGPKLYTIANGFNHTKLKKRITMMIQEKTNGWERLKWLVTVPVVMGAMLVFAQPEVKNKSEEIPPKPFEGIEITLLNSKDGSVLTTVKDIKHINQLKDALKKLPTDKSEPYIHVQLKAGKDTPMSGITEIKEALREHYILNLNYETNK